MRLWAKAPARQRPKRVAKKIDKRGGLLHYKLAVMTEQALRVYPRALIFDEVAEQLGMPKFILSARHNPYPMINLIVFMEFVRDHNRCVVGNANIGVVNVSTVFLRFGHPNFDGSYMFFETMTGGGGPWDDNVWRYRTWAEAKAGHEAVVEAVRSYFEDGSVRSIIAQAIQE